MNATSASPAPDTALAHYENFPVASLLCPPALRPPIQAIYRFARVADDLADEGDAAAQTRLDDLSHYLQDLRACHSRGAVSQRWPQVFGPLASAIEQHRLPLLPFEDLLSAFVQDVRMSAARAWYQDRAQLLDYCARSANPVGRLLLRLWGIEEPLALSRSDQICTALQLINFWQDLSIDLPRARYYLPLQDCQQFGLEPALLGQRGASERAATLIASLAHWTRQILANGAPLVHQVPGRAGWELRAVVQGGLRILDHIERLGPALFTQRPTLERRDWGLLIWRSLWMRSP